MILKRVSYPSEEFYSFEDGVKVDDERIEQWINEGIESVKKQLENGVESPYSMHATGNSIVIVFFSQDYEDDIFNDANYFEVVVAKNYEEGSFFIENIKENYYENNDVVLCSNLECPHKYDCARSILNTKDMFNVDIRNVQLENGQCSLYTTKL